MVKDKCLTVSSDGVFFSLQGEGMTMGAPSVFLRLYGCNLNCVWCDTTYAWTNKRNSVVQHWSIKKTIHKVKASWLCQNSKVQKRLVITGGEPLLQQELLSTFIKYFSDWAIEIETNGTIIPNEKLVKHSQFNCSPKTSNSKNCRSKRINSEAICSLCQANTVFKFVAQNKNDIIEAERDYIVPFKINPNRVVIMPEGKTRDQIIKNARTIVEIVNVKGYHLLLRLHIDLWGKRKQV